MIALLLAVLPAQLDPAPPFPQIQSDAPTIRAIAPGVDYGEYDMITSAGPIVIHALSIAPNAANIRLNTVLANDTLTSQGETVSSMAQRTGAIAGINGDYFDIGDTNRPTNVVVHDGVLVRSPRKRFALVIERTGLPQIIETSFLGTLQLPGRAVALDAVNAARGNGVTLLTPAYGSVPPSDETTLVALTPVDGTPPFATYRVTAIPDNTVAQPPGYYIAIGLDAYDGASLPNVGDTIAASGDLSPIPLADVSAAIGGGPLILQDGAWYDDPDGPNGGVYAQRIPCSGAALAADGTLFLLEVDGREPELSVGLTRPEFSSLMRAFGAVRGMAFDGGGSSEIAVRIPGDDGAALADVPSDGHERKVADGIFVYDTAPPGAPAQLVSQPLAVRAFVGASVPLRVRTVDGDDRPVAASDPIDVRVEPADLGTLDDGIFAAERAGDGTIVARAGALTLRVPLYVYADPARLRIVPANPSIAQGGRLTLQARAYDAQGYAIALPPQLPWRAQGASIDSGGVLTAGTGDAVVSLLLGDHLANARVAVGFHDVALIATPTFMSLPRGGDGDVETTPDCPACTQLRYALGPAERAAYLMTNVTLPQDTVGIAFDLLDDGQGALLKLALRNAIDEEVLVPAGTLDRPGWRSVEVRLPQSLPQPARLVAIYVIAHTAHAAIQGSIEVKNLHAVVAGR
ncbi:MAG TPA: phosphodiester glycosidase family protein [Candidatus Acidoferrales bacterium]|nr:phosphodiester glycosidase family protein [Candidatus Acidoferrales bacterium]